MKQAIAKIKNLKIAPRKVRLLCDVLRGMPVVAALAQLQVTNLRSAGVIAKMIMSAVANAKNLGMDPKKLLIKTITVNQGMMLKRYLPRARGSASELQKKFCHVMVALEESSSLKMPSYTVHEKPKKVRAEKAAKPGVKEKEPIKGAQEQSKTKAKKGFLRQVFNRKSI
ncbi:MAG: 50S ribosomal protein L22 [Candidatus Colwellbacteria bacterium RIFCSPLOWO2_01_FULL_48_10]|uniref:Large ribosomal subunit protein uL22 n=1 Tax=Candidatus Colwellbacteria bacterium RIFCSPLOWO2_01_FULL_48_10 TaxID=1797690 RepID=A0A1G1Z8J9_9BACT|nr:MAG: 50S ribosomal protein L22 [Candidatus Colwellbacteria bacterium RIFCSPLOWO2_01_FULL_48_10]